MISLLVRVCLSRSHTGPDTALLMVGSLPCHWDLINIPPSTDTEKLRDRGYGKVLLRDHILPQGFDSECPLSCSEFLKSTDCFREAGNCRLLIPSVLPLLVLSSTPFWELIKHIVIHTLFLADQRKNTELLTFLLPCPHSHLIGKEPVTAEMAPHQISCSVVP